MERALILKQFFLLEGIRKLYQFQLTRSTNRTCDFTLRHFVVQIFMMVIKPKVTNRYPLSIVKPIIVGTETSSTVNCVPNEMLLENENKPKCNKK